MWVKGGFFFVFFFKIEDIIIACLYSDGNTREVKINGAGEGGGGQLQKKSLSCVSSKR